MRVVIGRIAALAGLGLVVCGGWFAGMELLLRHDGYAWRVLIATAIVVEATLTIAVFENLVDVPALRWPLSATAAATGLLGGWIVADDVARPGLPASPHFEGYLLIIGAALIAHAVLTIAAMCKGSDTFQGV